MSIYSLPERKKDKKVKLTPLGIIALIVFGLASLWLGTIIGDVVWHEEEPSPPSIEEVVSISEEEYEAQTEHEALVMNIVEESMPSVVSIFVKKKNSLEVFYYGEGVTVEQENGDEYSEVGAGSGFIVSEDGIVITNKHVVSDEEAIYSVIDNDGEEYEVELLDENPVHDIAILKIKSDKTFIPLKLGDSSKIRLGQTAISIGNALGELENSVSVGVVSGLKRSVVATGDNIVENLENVIQTDAAINLGNSGGPLINLKGEVIAINTAVSTEAQSVGFAIPINQAKQDLTQIIQEGSISYPFIGIRYVLLNEEVAAQENLDSDYGALIIANEGDVSIVPDSPADEAGLEDGDIILEFNGEKITEKRTLLELIQEHLPGDIVTLKILSNGEEEEVELVLGDWKDFNL